jgi:hypothetical protein
VAIAHTITDADENFGIAYAITDADENVGIQRCAHQDGDGDTDAYEDAIDPVSAAVRCHVDAAVRGRR